MGTRTYTVRPLDESTWPAFAALVERNNGIFGGCWCMGFHPEGVGKGTTPELNRERSWPACVRTRHMRRSSSMATTAWAGASSARPRSCPGSRAAPPTRRGRRRRRSGGSRAATSERGYRRQGVAAAALAGALDLIAGHGGGTVEGYPEAADAVPAGFLYNGALSTYETAGVRPGPQDRQASLGRHQIRRAQLVETMWRGKQA